MRPHTRPNGLPLSVMLRCEHSDIPPEKFSHTSFFTECRGDTLRSTSRSERPTEAKTATKTEEGRSRRRVQPPGTRPTARVTACHRRRRAHTHTNQRRGAAQRRLSPPPRRETAASGPAGADGQALHNRAAAAVWVRPVIKQPQSGVWHGRAVFIFMMESHLKRHSAVN